MVSFQTEKVTRIRIRPCKGSIWLSNKQWQIGLELSLEEVVFLCGKNEKCSCRGKNEKERGKGNGEKIHKETP